MPDATVANATIRPEEAAHFAALAKDWWDPKGSSAMLHRLNPVRLGFLREAIDLHWGGDIDSLRPLAGKRALDVGCGAGLLCEPLARLGAEVTGVDAAPTSSQREVSVRLGVDRTIRPFGARCRASSATKAGLSATCSITSIAVTRSNGPSPSLASSPCR